MELDVSDSETLRAAAAVLRRRGFTATADDMEQLAQNVEAEDAAKLKAAQRDQRLGPVADNAYYATLGVNMTQGERWEAVARAVREAIEAES